MIDIQIANRQEQLCFDANRLMACARAILLGEGPATSRLSLAIVDDPTIHELNRKFLEHDYPTDVISFVLEQSENSLEGEVIASADTALSAASRYGWTAEDELMLYVAHGTLHVVGYDDRTPDAEATMREREQYYLDQFGMTPHYADLEEIVDDLRRSGSDGVVNGGTT